MFHKYTLQPAAWHQKPIDFEWDAVSGEIKGPDADTVLELVTAAIKEGSVIGHPYPTSFDIADPLHTISEIAVILGNSWRLSDDLASAYPVIDEDEPSVVIDEKGVEHLIEPIN